MGTCRTEHIWRAGTRERRKHVVSPYSQSVVGWPAGSMVKCRSTPRDSIFEREGCHTGGHPVGGPAQRTCNVTEKKSVSVLIYLRQSQWLTQEFCSGGGGGQQVQLRTEDRENGDLGAVAPYSGILEVAVIWYKNFYFV